jgi:antitoxin CptB
MSDLRERNGGSDDLDLRRRRARYRAWHRGIREMDLIMGAFADAEAATMSASDLAVFERLLEVPDPDIYAWITGEAEVPRDYDGPLFQRLVAFPTPPAQS